MNGKTGAAEFARAFGSESRRQMLEEYFAAAGAVTPENAWQHVYRLLLWIDRTTGLAHCYESDKAQPGRPWYRRSLAFHDWVSGELGCEPGQLGASIDWLFERGTERMARALTGIEQRRSQLAAEQRRPYEGRGFPEPGDNPALGHVVREELEPYLTTEPPPEVMRRLARRIRAHFTQENKRKNLVGEGFEDALASVIERLPGIADLSVHARPLLHALPGFRPPPGNEKPRRVDVAVVGPQDRRVLVSAKWSVRADREEQFGVDFEAYARLDDAGRDFAFVLVTNEFDAARLVAACERRRQNAALFSSVVHVNPAGVLAAYGTDPRRSASKLAEHITGYRLTSLAHWLSGLTTATPSTEQR
ncbi:MAG: hypothetical protein Q8R92_03885 [Deltaproteobacteria bacterium]|nr:hypothetical protein [Deltaproteobacteria bacterium]